MSEEAYIKVTLPREVKDAASKHIQATTGLNVSQWLRSKVFEAARGSNKVPK
jgi:hypothetical protein